jgi:hypothetical protein
VLPSKILPESGELDEDSINAANQFLYSTLSNDKFMRWVENYRTELKNQYKKMGKLPDKKIILNEFAKGLLESGDPKILRDLLEISPKTIATNLPGNAALVNVAIFVTKVYAILEFTALIHLEVLVHFGYSRNRSWHPRGLEPHARFSKRTQIIIRANCELCQKNASVRTIVLKNRHKLK